MRHLAPIFASALVMMSAPALAQDPHAGHVAAAAAESAQTPPSGHEHPTAVPPVTGSQPGAPAEDLAALMRQVEEAAGEEKVALMAALLGRLVAAQSSSKCGGAGHSCPMCAQHKAAMQEAMPMSPQGTAR
jgi:hypothetical protein